MNTENKKYMDRIKRGEELDDGSKEVPRTAPSSLDSSKLSSLFVVNVCMRVWIMWMCVSPSSLLNECANSLFIEWISSSPLAGEAHFSLLLPTAPADPYLAAHACLPMLGCPCLLDHACLPMLVYPCLPTADKYMCGCPCLAHGSRDVVTLKVMAANMTFLWT